MQEIKGVRGMGEHKSGREIYIFIFGAWVVSIMAAIWLTQMVVGANLVETCEEIELLEN